MCVIKSFSQFGIIMAVLLASCSGQVAREQEALKGIIGREIVIPVDLSWQIGDTPIEPDTAGADYRIVAFVDSAGCTPCQMKLALWNGVMNELAMIADTDIEMLMIVQSPKTMELDFAVKSNEFFNPISFDSAGVFVRNNELPSKAAHRTFLLDHAGKILAVGNPALNPKIKELYKKIILEGEAPASDEFCPRPVRNFGLAHSGDTIIKQFELQNGGDKPLSIQGIVPSCDCVTAVAANTTIQPGGHSLIDVTYVADSIPGRKNQYVEVYFNEKESPQRLVLHGRVLTNRFTNSKTFQK